MAQICAIGLEIFMSSTQTPASIPPDIDRITLVLRAGKVESLDNFRKNAKLGGIVMIDSSVAYIAGLSEGDATDGLEPDLVAIIAELQRRLDLVDKAPVNQIAQTSESVNQTTDIPAVADSMHIDDRVKMAANAKRYEWLRDVAATTGSGHTPMVKVAGGPGRWRTGDDLDQSIDQAMRSWPGQQDEELHPCAD